MFSNIFSFQALEISCCLVLPSRDLAEDSLASPVLKLEHNVHFGGVKKDAGAEAGSQGEQRCFSLVLVCHFTPGVFHFHKFL